MMTQSPDIHDLSRYRSELMGIAMIAVMLFHVVGPQHDTVWYCIARCGNIGVDIFLFLSGIGLWYAWTASPSLKHYYKRRLLRIYPAWLLFACIFYIPIYMDGKETLAETIGNVLIGWRLWVGHVDEFWFIPTILVFYLVAPFYMMLIRRWQAWRWMPVAAIMLCVLIEYWPPLHMLSLQEILFSRIPIFLLGINAGKWVKTAENKEQDSHLPGKSGMGMLLLIFMLSAMVCINFEDGLRDHFPMFLERMVYIPLGISMMLLLCWLFNHVPQWVLRPLALIGTVSLELYLVHVNFVLYPLRKYEMGFWLTALSMIAISLIIAWLVHQILSLIFKKWNKK